VEELADASPSFSTGALACLEVRFSGEAAPRGEDSQADARRADGRLLWFVQGPDAARWATLIQLPQTITQVAEAIEERRQAFNGKLMLFFTGISRTSSEIAGKQEEGTKAKAAQLTRMQAMVHEASRILSSENAELDDFGRMLHEAWMLKRSLTDKISNTLIDGIYETAMAKGALGGKILGAGGGGFLLFYVPESRRSEVKKALRNLIHVPFKFDDQGCQMVMYAPKEYAQSVYERRDFIHMQQREALRESR
jgi:mevalonate kinase